MVFDWQQKYNDVILNPLFFSFCVELGNVLNNILECFFVIHNISCQYIVSRCLFFRDCNYHSLISIFTYVLTCRRSSLVITTKIFWGGKYVYLIFFSPSLSVCPSFSFFMIATNEIGSLVVIS